MLLNHELFQNEVSIYFRHIFYNISRFTHKKYKKMQNKLFTNRQIDSNLFNK